MYTAYYNLKEAPFNQSVNPRYTWLSENQLDALAKFKQNYIDNNGFLLITGETGTGKTAFTKKLLAEIEFKTIVATVTDPDLDQLDFFNWLSVEFKMNVMFNSKGAFLTRFKKFLLEAYQKNIRVTLIIDDAHRINPKLIEEILTLSNMEKAGKQLSIIIVGQSGFNKILQQKQNSALKQRIKAHFHLTPLTENEIVQLILYRLKVAGAKAEIFSPGADHEIYRFSAGYPRMAVNICDRAMMAGCVSAAQIIDKDVVIECGKDLQIAGIKREIEDIDYLNDIPESQVPAAETIAEKTKEIKTSSPSYLKIKLAPMARSAILPVFLAIVVIVAIYFIYHFKSVLLSWASIDLEQVKSNTVQSEPSASNITPKKEIQSEANALLPANEVEKSIQTDEKIAELSDDSYVLDELKIDEKLIFLDDQSEPAAEDSSDKPPAVNDVSNVDDNNGSLQIQVLTDTANKAALEEKVTEIFPEAIDTNIEKLSLESPDIETEKESTNREFKMLSRRLALKLKLSEIEQQEEDIQEILLEPKLGRVISAQPANDSKAWKEVQLPQSVAKKPYLTEKERQEADIQIVQIKPVIGKVSDTNPQDDSDSRKDIQLLQPVTKKLDPVEKEPLVANTQTVRLESNIEEISNAQSEDDTIAGIDIQSQQSTASKTPPQPPPVKSDVDPISPTQPESETIVAGLGQVNKEEDQANRLNLKERLQSFLEVYCQTYESKDLEHFSTFFAPDAQENDKPFHNLLPKYRHNFDVIEFITYRIELQNYKYGDNDGMIDIEGRFFLEWLPAGGSWRRNSGKIFMELLEAGPSFQISRLHYYGDQRKKDR